jgi:hypothetical protein
MTPFRDSFTTFLPVKASSADGITGHKITPQSIGTIRQQIDNQVLEIPNVGDITPLDSIMNDQWLANAG